MNAEKLEHLLGIEAISNNDQNDPFWDLFPIGTKYVHYLDKEVDQRHNETSLLKAGVDEIVEVQPLKKSREEKRMRKLAREAQLTDGWFGMKAQDKDSDAKNQYLLMKLKKYIDPKNPAKASDLKSIPKYYQIGTVIDGEDNFGIQHKIRKFKPKNIIDQFLSLDDEKLVSRKKFGEIQSRQQRVSSVNQKLKRLKNFAKRIKK